MQKFVYLIILLFLQGIYSIYIVMKQSRIHTSLIISTILLNKENNIGVFYRGNQYVTSDLTDN